ncbi:hypothetical protein HOD20_07110 [archaeon]|jgi:hypothetical protein|nr:hypothetical protein [archaeon]MBT4352274.1 hypothetical protein [archaeon]MBT4648479.1 hypothetical protein [archaeon]MBT6821712.1 hypothetical protein [archaeon]MBT7391375.1 hypothetical protein [archaeon]
MKLHHRIKKRMKEKNWEDNYINKTLEILHIADKKKHPFLKWLDKAMVWFALFISIIGNLLVSLALGPMVLILPLWVIILMSIILGICFGALVDMLIRDIEYITHHHYIIASVFLPIIALINIFVVTKSLMWLSTLGRFNELFPNFHINDIKIIFPIYLVSFLIPHTIYKIIEKIELKNV